jgi:protein-S-isoprenylcysteine O-methyltransferase Ste14
MPRRVAYLLLSAAGWTGFLVIMLWTIAFLAGVVAPRTVDGPARTTLTGAVAIDFGLLLLFGVQHSVMARRGVKSWLRRRTPDALERTWYVLATDLCLALLLLFWQPWGGQVWRADGAAAVVLWLLCGAGWVLAIVSTFAVDHLELLGLRQAGWVAPRQPAETTPSLKVDGLHGIVRHPLMTGLLLAIAVGILFEERDLRRLFGLSYDDYAARVPALVPGTPIKRGTVDRPRPRRAGSRAA